MFGKKHNFSSLNEAGQVLLIVVLVIIVASTVGLSVATRSITSLRTSTEEAESQKALAAAEAGLERAIQAIIPAVADDDLLSGDLINNSSYEVSATPVNDPVFLLNGGLPIPKDEGADIWFAEHFETGEINYDTVKSLIPPGPNFFHLNWGSADEDCTTNLPAAIEVIVVARDPDPLVLDANPSKYKSYRYAYDSCDRDNNFAGTALVNKNKTIDGRSFTIRTPDGVTELARDIENIVFMRVIPIYKSTVIGVSGCDNQGNGNNCVDLPDQGYKYESTGTAGQANRKLTVFKGWPQIPAPFLSYGLFVTN